VGSRTVQTLSGCGARVVAVLELGSWEHWAFDVTVTLVVWLCAVRFRWGARLGAVLSEVRVCLIGWLLFATFWGSTRREWWVGSLKVRARHSSIYFLCG
jgi:hypothetical protein